jgi:imidazoleglycerol-phosphate dehydratase / histidinol-phosphatase
MNSDLLSFRRVGLARASWLETLRQRYAAQAGCEPSGVVFLPSPEAVDLIGIDAADVEQLGPVEAPITAIRLASPNPDAARWEALLSDGLVEAGLTALLPVAMASKKKQNSDIEDKIKVVLRAFEVWNEIESASAVGDRISLTWADEAGAKARLAAIGLDLPDSGQFRVLSVEDARALAERLATPSTRSASVRRTTKETDILVSVNLEQSAPVRISTGVEYFDHMLEQIAKHGGFSLEVDCEGDIGIDAHHTIEDVALAFGDALAKALGDRRGIGRFGFELPMDETRAGVWIDLSGRPFSKFDGNIPGERVGEFPVEMTAHVFRSIADSLKAAIHVSVEGENAHHMIEACFKAFGRTLRQAVKVEGDAIPSTKGVL